MKMHAIRGENMMRMKVFDLDLDAQGNTIIVSGKNGEGKSSLINSVVLCLGGSKTDVAKLTTKPIREGEKKAWVEVDVGDWTVRRQWLSNDKDTLSITGKNGEKFSSPQKMLDKVLGNLSFDPLAFTRMKPKEQRELLLSIVDVPLDLAAHDAKYQEVFDKRTIIGREVDRLAGAIETAAAQVPAGVPDAEVSVVALTEKLMKMKEERRDIAERQYRFDEAVKEVARLEELLNAAMTARDQHEAWLDEHKDGPDPQDIGDLEYQIDKAEETNAGVRAKKKLADLRAEHTAQEAKYVAGTKYLAEMAKKKADALEQAEMPVEGLGLDDDGVTFKGIPFGQLSMSQKIKVSTAIGIAQNPELPLMIIWDGALLDSKNLADVKEIADANDCQIMVEMVDENAESGIIIEDGEVVPPKA